MKKCLFVDCCLNRDESRTKKLAEAFVSELKGYEVEHLVLENEDLKPLVGDFFFDRQKLLNEGNRTHERFKYAWQFKNADMVVIAAPFWDLCFPALLKIYIENISVDGITFKTGEKGLEGNCNAEHLVYLTTRGGIYGEDNPMDIAKAYMKCFLPFFGFKQLDFIAADGVDIVGFDGNKSLEDAKQKARDLAKTL